MYKLRTLAFLLVGFSTMAYGQFEDQIESGIFKGFDNSAPNNAQDPLQMQQMHSLYEQQMQQQHEYNQQELDHLQREPSNGRGDGEINFFNPAHTTSSVSNPTTGFENGNIGDEDNDPVAPINDYILLLLLFAIALGYKYHKKTQLN